MRSHMTSNTRTLMEPQQGLPQLWMTMMLLPQQELP